MHKREHTKHHKRLDSALNELVADFFENSGIPPHLATVYQLLLWSEKQAQDAEHQNHKGRHESTPNE